MFQYEYEKRSPSRDGRQTSAAAGWSQSYPSRPSEATSVATSVERARRPLPPRPTTVIHETLPTKTTVPLKVWIIASASCFAVCAALVLATVAITRWGAADNYPRRQLYQVSVSIVGIIMSLSCFTVCAALVQATVAITRWGAADNYPRWQLYQVSEPLYSPPFPETPPQAPYPQSTTVEDNTEADISLNSEELENDIQFPILEKLSIFKNIVANREKNKRNDIKKPDNLNLISKPQIHPIHDTSLHHPEKKIEKKDQPKYPMNLNPTPSRIVSSRPLIPNFKPTLPEIVLNRKELNIIDLNGPKKLEVDYEEYYNDDNLYDDYMQSNTMTSYLIEKVQELHEWITTDPDFVAVTNATKREAAETEFGQLLKALNESLVEGNVTIIMTKLKDIYFGANYTHANHTRKVILSNSTDLLSFGILTLDVMLLHNIQLMAWENQEAVRAKMLRDPDVFAFNALFLEPNKLESRQNDPHHHEGGTLAKRPSLRADSIDEFDLGKALLENVLEVGMSTARAAIHLGRAYKNTKMVLSQLSNRDTLNANIQTQISRNVEGNSHALQHLQTSFSNGTAGNTTVYTELDCVWLLYCKNLVATAKLNPPYGTMARINGLALRMLTGELSADHALDTMLYEALTGWTELRCADMFPRCSKADAATVVMESLLTPARKTQAARV